MGQQRYPGAHHHLLGIYSVDVSACGEQDRPIHISKCTWRRYRVEARDGTEAELVAVQMAYATQGQAVSSVVVDWPED